jgi:multiple sugar transport system substrate-binding protein
MFILLSKHGKGLFSLKILLLSLITSGCNNFTQPLAPPSVNSSKNTTLTIWWDKGSNVEEDDALIKLIKDWEKRSGNRAKLSFYSNDKLPETMRRAVQACHE